MPFLDNNLALLWDVTTNLTLWDVTTGARTAGLEGHYSSVSALCLLPNGRLASGSYDKTIRLWDVTTRAETARLEVDGPIYAIVALGQNRIVAGDELGLHWLEIVN